MRKHFPYVRVFVVYIGKRPCGTRLARQVLFCVYFQKLRPFLLHEGIREP